MYSSVYGRTIEQADNYYYCSDKLLSAEVFEVGIVAIRIIYSLFYDSSRKLRVSHR